MLLAYFIFNAVNSITFIILYCAFSYLNISSFIQFSSVLDVYVRLNSNDSIFTNAYYFWTSLYYLYFFVFIMFIIRTLFKINFTCNLILILCITLNLAFYDYFTEIYYLNIVEKYKTIFNTSLNKLLTNKINKIHPLLLYLSLIFLIKSLVVYQVILTLKGTKQQQNIKFIIMQPSILPSLILIVTAMVLGSWWAFQEGSWGGWWNWDTSELFGLIIFYRLVYYFHSNFAVISSKFYMYNSLLTCYLTLSFYLILQINFEASAHNFGFKAINLLVRLKLISWMSITTLLLLVSKLFKDLSNVNSFTFIINRLLPIQLIVSITLPAIILYLSITSVGLSFLISGTLKSVGEYDSFLSGLLWLITLFIIIVYYPPYIVFRILLGMLAWGSFTTNLFLFYAFDILIFFKNFLHFILLLTIIITLITIPLEEVYSNSYNISYLKEFLFGLVPNNLIIDLPHNFIKSGLRGELRNFLLFIKDSVIQQEFLFIDKSVDLTLTLFEYSALNVLFFVTLTFLFYISYLYSVIIF